MSIELVYAVILNWNRRDDTLACLASLLAMEPPVFKAILVDNGSSDGTPGAVAERFPQVNVIVNDKNLGFAGGMNTGIEAALQAGAAWVLILNNDTLLAPDMLGALLGVARQDPAIGIVAPKIYYAQPVDRIWYAGAMRRRWYPGFAFPGYGQKDHPRYDRRRDVDYATGCGMLVRAAVLRRVGLFDQATFFMYHEDLDLSERVQRAGYRIVYAPRARMWHKESASTAPLSPEKWYYLARYVVPFFQRYYRWPRLAAGLYAAYVIGRELVKGRLGVIRPFVRGTYDGLIGSSTQSSPALSSSQLEGSWDRDHNQATWYDEEDQLAEES
jgi:GT2 family glycosyltransferase